MSDPAAVNELDKQIFVETIGSVLWFVMDGFWMLGLAFAAKAMIWPTLAVNLFVFRYTSRSFSQFCVVGAMNSWLLMNIFWMIGDLDKDPGPLEIARWMFGLGMMLLAMVVARNAADRDGLIKVLSRFRRLRT